MADIIVRRETPGVPGPNYIYTNGKCYERGDPGACGDIYTYNAINDCDACVSVVGTTTTSPEYQESLFFKLILDRQKTAMYQGNSFWAVSKRARRNNGIDYGSEHGCPYPNMTGISGCDAATSCDASDGVVYDGWNFTPMVTDFWDTGGGYGPGAGGFTDDPAYEATLPLTEDSKFGKDVSEIQITTEKKTLPVGDEWSLGHLTNPWHCYGQWGSMDEWAFDGWFWKPAGTAVAGPHDTILPDGLSDPGTWSDQVSVLCGSSTAGDRYHHIAQDGVAPDDVDPGPATGINGEWMVAIRNPGPGNPTWDYTSVSGGGVATTGNCSARVHFNDTSGSFSRNTYGIGGCGCQVPGTGCLVQFSVELGLGRKPGYDSGLTVRPGIAASPINTALADTIGTFTNARGAAQGISIVPVQENEPVQLKTFR